MYTLFVGFFICVLFLPFTTPFFTAPVSTILTYASRNLTCSGQADTLRNGTITYQNGTDSIEADYCFITIVTSLVNNLTETVTSRYAIYIWNMYRNIAINQCNFSKTMDIGYGSCTPNYYETATSIQLCICSTNYCSATYASCQASVNQALSSPPPLLPVLQPTLSNTITCQDYYVNYSATYNITPPIYLGCEYLITLGGPDPIKCYTYTPNHTVICMVFYDPIQGSFQRMALIEGDYEVFMDNTINTGAYGVANNSSGIYQYQTSTIIATLTIDTSGQYTGFCLCTTNNCNVDFTTCTSGMNIPSYLLAYNGSTSTTVSTRSTSTGATISSGSTTRSTSSASRSNSTTLRSSATTSGTGVGNNTTLPSNRTSSSISEKPFYSKLLVTIVLALSLSLFKMSYATDLS